MSKDDDNNNWEWLGCHAAKKLEMLMMDYLQIPGVIRIVDKYTENPIRSLCDSPKEAKILHRKTIPLIDQFDELLVSTKNSDTKFKKSRQKQDKYTLCRAQ
jgi:hypothetical protein